MANSFFSLKNSIIIPLILAGIGVFLVIQYLQTKESELGLSAELVPVIVANADMPAYTKLDRAMVSYIKVPKKFLQPSVVNSVEEVDNRVTLIPLLKGEQILSTMLSGSGESGGLALKIRKGFRAISVGVDGITGVAGLIRPGDKVDILGTFELSKGDDRLEKRTFTILHNIPVLAVGKDLGVESMVGQAFLAKDRKELEDRVSNLRKGVKKDHKRKQTVTLLVDPGQAQKVTLTQSLGEVVLSLCPVVGDEKGTLPPSIDGKQMLGVEDEIYLPRAWGEIRGARRD